MASRLRSPYQKAHDIVKAKFFSLNTIDFRRFSQIYAQHFGPGAVQYLNATYHSWKSGATGMSGQTEHRLLKCVPKVMTEEEQFEILRLYEPAFTSAILSVVKRRGDVEVCDLEARYANLARAAAKHIPTLDWFVSDIFSEDEIFEFANVIRFIFMKKLANSYDAVCEDLVVLSNAIAGIKARVDVNYKIGYLDTTVRFVTRLCPKTMNSADDITFIADERTHHASTSARGRAVGIG